MDANNKEGMRLLELNHSLQDLIGEQIEGDFQTGYEASELGDRLYVYAQLFTGLGRKIEDAEK